MTQTAASIVCATCQRKLTDIEGRTGGLFLVIPPRRYTTGHTWLQITDAALADLDPLLDRALATEAQGAADVDPALMADIQLLLDVTRVAMEFKGLGSDERPPLPMGRLTVPANEFDLRKLSEQHAQREIVARENPPLAIGRFQDADVECPRCGKFYYLATLAVKWFRGSRNASRLAASESSNHGMSQFPVAESWLLRREIYAKVLTLKAQPKI